MLAVASGTPIRGAGAQSSYYYFDKPVPLETRKDWVALFSAADESLSVIRAFLESAGIIPLSTIDHPMPGWSLYYAPGNGGQAALMETLTDADLDDGVRDYFFAPVYRGASGLPTMPGNAVLLHWPGGPDLDILNASLPAGCLGDTEPEPFGGVGDLYRLQPRCHSGLDLMNYANALAELEGTVFSEPDMIVGGLREPGEAPLPAGAKAGSLTGSLKGGLKLTPSDSFFDDSWHWDNTGQAGGKPGIDVNTPPAWDLTTGDASIVTAIIDVGVQQDHPDINQMTGADFTSQNNPDGGPVNTCDDHGTPIAGAVSAPINNEGTVGAAPGTITRSARAFISETPEPCSGRWTTQFSWTVNALDWAQSQGARITNNSNSYDQQSSSIATKYEQTHEAGMVHFASAGNDGSSGVNFPASLPSVNALSAIGPGGGLAEFSNFGAGVSLAAPGVDIHLPDREGAEGYVDGAYLVGGGTSYASPIAAGVGALLLSRANNLDGSEVELFLQASARDLGASGPDNQFGWGLVDAHAALLLLDIYSDDLESGDTSNWSETVP